jgi:hypothetical protein
MPQTTQPCASSQVVGGGATSAGTIINGGLGVDTFTPGTGYDGGKHTPPARRTIKGSTRSAALPTMPDWLAA